MNFIRRAINSMLAGCVVIAVSCSTENEVLKKETTMNNYNKPPESSGSQNTQEEVQDYFTAQSTVGDVVNDSAFEGFGHLLFPVDRNVPESMTLSQVSTSNVYVWYSHISVAKTVEILNYLKSEVVKGNRIFYSIYSPEHIARDGSKSFTGIFKFSGETGKPFAITNAGGGFAYVGAMHDSFPHSLEISRAGYTSFALIYRPDDPYSDLAQAISFIEDNAEELGVKKTDYSLWGGSAGARMAAVLGNIGYLYQLTGRRDLPEAAAIVMQYTGYTDVSEYDAPTYVCVGDRDGIASWRTMQYRLERLAMMGIPTEFHVYEGLGHGFGIGEGTVAEGWVKDAIKFWEANMKDKDSGVPLVKE